LPFHFPPIDYIINTINAVNKLEKKLYLNFIIYSPS